VIAFNFSKLWLHVWKIYFTNTHYFILYIIQELLLKVYLSCIFTKSLISYCFTLRIWVLIIDKLSICVHWLSNTIRGSIIYFINRGPRGGKKNFRFSLFNRSQSRA